MKSRSTFSGLAALVLFLSLYSVSLCSAQTVRLLSNNHLPQKVMVVLNSSNVDFVDGLIQVIKEVHESSFLSDADTFKLHIVPSHSGIVKKLKSSNKDISRYVEVNDSITASDIWMQDIGEFCAVEKDGVWQSAFFDSLRGRGLGHVGPWVAENWNLGYFDNPSKIGKCGDYGGNLEVTPDNIFFHGDTISDGCRKFMLQHGYEGREIVLQTSWLTVGHIDEYMMIIPTKHSPCGYTLVRSDPLYALDLIEAAKPEDFELLPDPYKTTLPRLQAALKDPNAWANTDEAKFIELNRVIGELIEANVGKFLQEVRRISGNSSHEVPVVAWPNIFRGRRSGSNKLSECVAYTPGVVNHLVIRDHLVVPDPFFPPFRRIVEARFRSQGNKVHFLNDLVYHDKLGEIHCGTNVLRDPNRVFVTPKAARAVASLRASFEELHAN